MPAVRAVTRAADLDDVVANGNKIPASLLPSASGGSITEVSGLATGGAGTLVSPYTGWDAALAALVVDGANFLFRGFFQAASNIDLSNRTSVTLQGYDGHLGQATYNTPAIDNWTCGILFNIQGPNIKAWNTAGITIRGMLIRNTQTVTFTTALVDGSGGSGDNVSIGMTVEDCVLDAAGGTGSGAPDSCLKLDNAIECRCTGVCFYGAKYNIRGVENYPYSTAHSFRQCRFHSSTQSAIFNPHAQWNFRDCIFEPGAGHSKWVRTDLGMANASGAGITGLLFDGCRQWDSSSLVAVMHFDCYVWNLTIVGCFFSLIGGSVVSSEPAVPVHGLVMIGNYFENAGGGTVLDASSTGVINHALIAGNYFDPDSDNLAAVVTSGQITGGLVVNGAGTQLLPVPASGGASVAVGEQRIISTLAVPSASAGGWSGADGGLGTASMLTVFNSSAGDTNYLEFKVYLSAGTYTLDFSSRVGTDQGKVQFSLDGVNFGTLLDLYAASGGTVSQSMAGVVVGSSAVHAVRLTVTGKNASSSGYYARLGTFWAFTRTA